MQEKEDSRDPAIKLFGKKIPLSSNGDSMAVSVDDVAMNSEEREEEEGAEEEEEEGGVGGGDISDGEESNENKDAPAEVLVTESMQQQQDDAQEVSNTGTSPESENPKTPSIDEENPSTKSSKTAKEQGDTPNSQEKTLKKPDKILPCPRCNSMDTKFCYYNNYNVNQPRHFCKACQRYWTAGGTMRNVPVGAGRRKNKNAASRYRHITISEALQAARIDVPNGTHIPNFKSNGTVLTFGLDSPMSDSVASVLNLAEKKAPNGTRNGFHNIERPAVQIPCPSAGNGDDSSSRSSVTNTNSTDSGSRNFPQEQVMKNVNGLHPQIPCLPGVPWPYTGNPGIPPPPFCPPGMPMPFYPAAFWTYGIPGAWNMPWMLSQSPSPSPKPVTSDLNSPTLGKHSRDTNTLETDNSAEGDAPKQKNGCVLIPKTLRIDDPREAAKSSIWATLGIKNDALSKGGLFKAFHSQEGKDLVPENPPVLCANPAALSRSISFRERT